jgi:hypothetical protein
MNASITITIHADDLFTILVHTQEPILVDKKSHLTTS